MFGTAATWLKRASAAIALMAAVGGHAQPRLENFEQRILATHNAERARLGFGPLKWSPALAANAAKWANHLASLDDLEHDDSLDVEGENLWRGSKSVYTPEDMVTLWIDEKKAFRNVAFPNVSISGQWADVGHYTQVIWRSTGLIGCAFVLAGEDEVLVCRYMEGGNILNTMTY
jgi:hypothetical protein